MTPSFQSVVDISQIEEMVDVSGVSQWDPLLAAAAVAVGVLLGFVLGRIVRALLRKSDLPDNVADLGGTVVMWSVVTMSALVALSLVGFQVAPVVIATVIIAVGFLVTGRLLLENLGAGVALQTRAPFQPGDEIRVGETVGAVVEVNSRVVVIDTIDDKRVLVPNSSVLASHIVNLTAHDSRMSTVDVELIYGTDIPVAREILVAAMISASGVLTDPAPMAHVRAFNASGISFAARFWHAPEIREEWAATDAVISSIDAAVKAHGLRIAFPQRTLWWGTPDAESQAASVSGGGTGAEVQIASLSGGDAESKQAEVEVASLSGGGAERSEAEGVSDV